MNPFDFTNAGFIRAGDGPWELDRNWNDQPATPLEVERLFAFGLLMDSLLAGLVAHLAAGNLQVPHDLDDIEHARVRKYLAHVQEVMSPASPERPNGAR